MSLIADLERLCARLAPLGWGDLLLQHGLDLEAPNLAGELGRTLPAIDRRLPGFEDFCTGATRGVEPGDPAMSLLYHALTSPAVHPEANARHHPAGRYPTLDELDTLETYIYGLRPLDSSALDEAVIAVFAYQYRPGSSSAHRAHADLAFSRTGVARVGTGEAAWDPAWRSFRPDPAGGDGIAVTPARYGAFVARPVRPDARDPILGRRDRRIASTRSTIRSTSCSPARDVFAA